MIQTIIQFLVRTLFFWHRGAEDGSEVAPSLEERGQVDPARMRLATYSRVSTCGQRRSGDDQNRQEFERLLPAAHDSQVEFVLMHTHPSSKAR